MGMQDSIYDVAAALEGKPEKELFEEILEWAYSNEGKLMQAQAELHNYNIAMSFLGQKLGITPSEI